jgi:hypothetical protein
MWSSTGFQPHDGIDGTKKADELAKAAAVREPIPDKAKWMVQLGAAAMGELRKDM